MAKCLVLWDDVETTEGWIDEQVPLVVRQALFGGIPVVAAGGGGVKTLDVRTAFTVYLNVISGLCWGMGLVYAGKTTFITKPITLNTNTINTPINAMNTPSPLTQKIGKLKQHHYDTIFPINKPSEKTLFNIIFSPSTLVINTPTGTANESARDAILSKLK